VLHSPLATAEGGISPFRELLDTVNHAVARLSGYDVKIDRLRLGQYRRDIEDLARADESGNLTEVVRERVSHRLAASLLEAAELRRLYKAVLFFSGGPLETALHDLLRIEDRASDDHARSGGNDTLRDPALEVTVAARLAACGFRVQMGADGVVEAAVGDNTVVFECTRIHSARDIGARIRDAQRRLAERCAGRPEARGILALAITRMEELRLDFLISPDPMQLSRRLEQAMQTFVERHAHLWARPTDPSLIGTFTYVARPVLVGAANRLTYAQHSVLQAVPFAGDTDRELLWLIDQRLGLLSELCAALP